MTEKLKVTPINPFCSREVQVIEELANDGGCREVARKLGISEDILRRRIEQVFDKIEEITGERPAQKNWIPRLYEDVLILENRTRQPDKDIT